MHISTSFNQGLNTGIALAEYLPFKFGIFSLQICLNSSAASCKLCTAIQVSCLVLLLWGCGINLDQVPMFGISSASLSVSLPYISVSGSSDRSKDTGLGPNLGADDTNPLFASGISNMTLGPCVLLVMGVIGTWGRWPLSNTSTFPVTFLHLLFYPPNI